MSSTYGENLKLSIFGQSHGPAIGMVLDGIPAGLPVDPDKLQEFLNRRAPGQNNWSTPRREEDRPEFLGGILDGYTCGAPIAAMIRNKNTRSGDYENLKDCPRPGHADYTAQVKYGGFQDAAGGGHFSGRLTAPLCIAGGLCKQWLEESGIRIGAKLHSIGTVGDDEFDMVRPQLDQLDPAFPVLNQKAGEQMKDVIQYAKDQGDSVGGMITCAITGLPAGLGEPMFGGVESKIAQIVYGIPAVKEVSFGSGSYCSLMYGSQINDCFTMENGEIRTLTNHCGGIQGGITNGMPVVFTVAFKPTPSVSLPQQSVSLSRGENATLEIRGRHDPCIVPRAVPVVEAAAAIAIYDLILGNTQTDRRKP
ncbi:MAG: chorismate synthase [Oscillospiraceae bacterium]|nr:chorismate synthase [Oscillospiraceae bacterium]MBQ7129508.1 chorismate synthase [Oscillospiraceae bacterium]